MSNLFFQGDQQLRTIRGLLVNIFRDLRKFFFENQCTFMSVWMKVNWSTKVQSPRWKVKKVIYGQCVKWNQQNWILRYWKHAINCINVNEQYSSHPRLLRTESLLIICLFSHQNLYNLDLQITKYHPLQPVERWVTTNTISWQMLVECQPTSEKKHVKWVYLLPTCRQFHQLSKRL